MCTTYTFCRGMLRLFPGDKCVLSRDAVESAYSGLSWQCVEQHSCAPKLLQVAVEVFISEGSTYHV